MGLGWRIALRFAQGADADRLEVRAPSMCWRAWDPVDGADAAASEAVGVCAAAAAEAARGRACFGGRASYGLSGRSGWSFRMGIRRLGTGFRRERDAVFVAPDELECMSRRGGWGGDLRGLRSAGWSCLGWSLPWMRLPALSRHGGDGEGADSAFLVCAGSRDGTDVRVSAVCAGAAGLPGPDCGGGGYVCAPEGWRMWIEGYTPPYDARLRTVWADAGPGGARSEPASGEGVG